MPKATGGPLATSACCPCDHSCPSVFATICAPLAFRLLLLVWAMGRDDVEQGQLPEKAKPPDGGWGWIILLGCFVITGFSYGFPKAVSIYFKDLMHDFHVGYSDTAWISSIMLAMLYGTGKNSTWKNPIGGINPQG